MELVTIPENPAPPGAAPGTIRAADGLSLRVVRWHPPRSRGTVVIASGRAEFVEKYFETVGDLLSRELTVVCFDWRGQGMSARELKNSMKGHVDDFSLYERDLDAVREQVLEPFCPKPWFALGHSMGGSILLAQAHAGRSPFDRLVLSAPMIDLSGLRSRTAAKLLCEAFDIAGLGGAFVPGGRRRPYILNPFERNILTSDRTRFERCAAIIAAAPQVAVGDPTIGWVNAAFRLMTQFADAEFPRRVFTPTLIVAAGADRVVDTKATERFGARLKAGDSIVLPYCLHEILLEREVFRKQFWAAFDSFIPGSLEGAAAPAAAQAPNGSKKLFGLRRRSASAQSGS
jgi:lysophospholipase